MRALQERPIPIGQLARPSRDWTEDVKGPAAFVTQVFNVPYRRFATCRLSKYRASRACSAVQGARSGRRLKICDTAGYKPALLHRPRLAMLARLDLGAAFSV